MPFVLLVLALLGGGLVCLLVVNTTLGATSFRISQLQSDNANLSLQEQTLLGQVASEESPQGIEQRAYQLGMRPEAGGNILDLRDHRYSQLPSYAGAQGQGNGAAPSAGNTTAGRTGAARRAAHRGGARSGRAGHRKRITHSAGAPKAGRTAPAKPAAVGAVAGAGSRQ
jgi:hypothetical protein